MDMRFWEHQWENNDISFHASEAHPLLVKYFGEFSLPKGSRIFLPLCGKSLDIHWLINNNCRVAGVEWSRIAVEQLFGELGQSPTIAVQGDLVRYSAADIDIFVGDVFRLSREELGNIDAIYDRAAMSALDQHTRTRYAAHLAAIGAKAPQLLITYQYDQRLLAGPPFSIGGAEVQRLYGASYDIVLLESAGLAGGVKGRIAATESVCLLR